MTAGHIILTTKITGTALLLMTSLALAAGHTAAPKTAKTKDGVQYLVDAHDMTLYVFDKDSKNTSNCYDACADKWPPLKGEEGMKLPEGYGLVQRKDDSLQISYKGNPLYLWFKDKKPGDISGDGVKGVWHIARP